jgi:multisubunit Na+/H+ antiporter MnhG subunit
VIIKNPPAKNPYCVFGVFDCPDLYNRKHPNTPTKSISVIIIVSLIVCSDLDGTMVSPSGTFTPSRIAFINPVDNAKKKTR